MFSHRIGDDAGNVNASFSLMSLKLPSLIEMEKLASCLILAVLEMLFDKFPLT